MYSLKENILEIDNQRNFAAEIGISEETLSRIISRKQKCSKMTAYSITKHYNSSKEINDYFERVD
jgi:plasmid maintenance system antidote protein VapI